MSGQEADYKGNFFEYVKAAGIISLFSIANAKLTETVNKYGSNNEAAAANLAESNAQFFNQLGSALTSQAMNVSPTLTVDNGTLINVMLNKTLYLPKAPGYPPGQKYILE
jgi:type IV secretory pathway VirB10-like protein